jgi:acetylornithine deacetylase/succinyl-diaminopimelate desuccinylase-like protein
VYRASPAAKAYLEAIADLEQSGPRHVFRRLDEVVSSPDPSGQLPVGTGKYFVDTVQVTVLSAGNGINAVPAKATALVDIRLLPDTDDEAFLAEIRQLLGHGVEVEVLVQTPPAPPSPTDHPLFLTLQETLSVRGPVIPTFLAGATDSRFFRQRGIPAYGFSPFAIAGDSLRGIHAEDEHIPAAAFLRGTEMLYRVVRAATR